MRAVLVIFTAAALALVSGNLDDHRLGINAVDASRLLTLDCLPPPSGPSGASGRGYNMPRPGFPRCHLWRDDHGYCRINWTHVIFPDYCRDTLGRSRYRSLPRYGPGQAGAPDADGGPRGGK